MRMRPTKQTAMARLIRLKHQSLPCTWSTRTRSSSLAQPVPLCYCFTESLRSPADVDVTNGPSQQPARSCRPTPPSRAPWRWRGHSIRIERIFLFLLHSNITKSYDMKYYRVH
jgi:hypothetical protein